MDFDNEKIRQMNEATARASSRIPKEGGLESMNINSYIASLTDHAKNPYLIPRMNQKLERSIGMFTYLRDTHKAQTVGEALERLSQRKVDPKVVKLWIEEEMAVNQGEFNSIAKGYPEFKGDLQKARDASLDKTLGKK